MNFDTPLPDISNDLDRLATDPPTYAPTVTLTSESPTELPSLNPVTPSPISEAPVSSSPTATPSSKTAQPTPLDCATKQASATILLSDICLRDQTWYMPDYFANGGTSVCEECPSSCDNLGSGSTFPISQRGTYYSFNIDRMENPNRTGIYFNIIPNHQEGIYMSLYKGTLCDGITCVESQDGSSFSGMSTGELDDGPYILLIHGGDLQHAKARHTLDFIFTPSDGESDNCNNSTEQPTLMPSPQPKPDSLDSSASTAATVNNNTQESTTTTTKTIVYSCPPPSPTIITSHAQNGTDITLEIKPSISTVQIPYSLQLILEGSEAESAETIDSLVPRLESQLEISLGEHYTSNTSIGENSTACDGYIIEDFRLRRSLSRTIKPVGYYKPQQQRRRTRKDDVIGKAEDKMSTKIIGISTENLSIDEDQQCDPPTSNCYVLTGHVDATYVGNNEAGVTSSISRVVKQGFEVSSYNFTEDNDGQEFSIQYMGVQEGSDSGGGFKLSDTMHTAKNIVNQWQQAIPERSGDEQLSPYGLGILAALGSAFLMVVYILFIKSDNSGSKHKALVEEDDERQTDDQSYCYDLESVVVEEQSDASESKKSGDSGDLMEDGVEIRSVCDQSDSGKTKKISNRAMDIKYMESLIEEGEEGADGCESTIGSSNLREPSPVSRLNAGASVRDTDSPSVERMNTPLAGLLISNSPGNTTHNTPLVDRCPSSAMEGPNEPFDDSPVEAVYKLPSISEAEGLPPPMNDTPPIGLKHRISSGKNKPKNNISAEFEENEDNSGTEGEWEV